jgi:hypothetical protein
MSRDGLCLLYDWFLAKQMRVRVKDGVWFTGLFGEDYDCDHQMNGWPKHEAFLELYAVERQ